MKKLILLISFIFIISNSYSSQVTIPTTYVNGGQVTAANLNGNFTAITNVVNGGLDNTNANTTSGYRFYQTVATLPSPGNLGNVYFLTTDDTLNFDTGSAFNKSVSVNSATNGDMLYYNSGWSKLAIGTSGKPLISNGTIPAYGQVTAASTVSTTALTGNITSGTSVSVLGSWTTFTCETAANGNTLQAATDLFVSVIDAVGQSASCITDSSATPTTLRSYNGAGAVVASCNMVVKKNDYYEGLTTGSAGTCYRIAIGS